MHRLLILLTLALAPSAAAAEAPLRLIGVGTVATGTVFQDHVIGGLSAIEYDPGSGGYLALPDQGPPRVIRFDWPVAADGVGTPAPTGTLMLAQPDRRGRYDPDTVDPEGLRLLPDGGLAWSDEGERTLWRKAAPAVREANTDGAFRRVYPPPTAYLPEGDLGIRNNLAFESLAYDATTDRLIAATENALTQDGPVADVATPSPARLLWLDRETGLAGPGHLYLTEPVAEPPDAIGGFRTNGLVELMMLADGALLAVEREFVADRGYRIRVFRVETAGATDITGAAIAPRGATPVSKHLLIDFAEVGLVGFTIGNVEGVTAGPRLDTGACSLVFVSDDNFGRFGETVSEFIAFEILDPDRIPVAC